MGVSNCFMLFCVQAEADVSHIYRWSQTFLTNIELQAIVPFSLPLPSKSSIRLYSKFPSPHAPTSTNNPNRIILQQHFDGRNQITTNEEEKCPTTSRKSDFIIFNVEVLYWPIYEWYCWLLFEWSIPIIPKLTQRIIAVIALSAPSFHFLRKTLRTNLLKLPSI